LGDDEPMNFIGLEKVSADIERMFREFNIQKIDDIKERFPVNRFTEMNIIIAHRDFDKLLDLYTDGKKFAIVSGRGPSGPIHFGHIYVFQIVKFLQDAFDAHVFIPLSDDEKLVFGKIRDLEEGEYWAYDNAKLILALGFDKRKTHIYISSKQRWVYRYALIISKKLTLSTAKSALGVEDSTNIGVPFYVAVQIAHILQPTLEKKLPVVVPIGLDQDVYMRLARDVSERLNIPKPASLYVDFVNGLDGEPMSSSKPDTAIFINDDEEKIWRKILRAVTGGQPTIEEHRRYGGDPNRCVIFQWMKAFIFRSMNEANKHAELCRNGEIMCGFDCKGFLAKGLINIARDLRRRANNIPLEDFLLED